MYRGLNIDGHHVTLPCTNCGMEKDIFKKCRHCGYIEAPKYVQDGEDCLFGPNYQGGDVRYTCDKCGEEILWYKGDQHRRLRHACRKCGEKIAEVEMCIAMWKELNRKLPITEYQISSILHDSTFEWKTIPHPEPVHEGEDYLLGPKFILQDVYYTCNKCGKKMQWYSAKQHQRIKYTCQYCKTPIEEAKLCLILWNEYSPNEKANLESITMMIQNVNATWHTVKKARQGYIYHDNRDKLEWAFLECPCCHHGFYRRDVVMTFWAAKCPNCMTKLSKHTSHLCEWEKIT